MGKNYIVKGWFSQQKKVGAVVAPKPIILSYSAAVMDPSLTDIVSMFYLILKTIIVFLFNLGLIVHSFIRFNVFLLRSCACFSKIMPWNGLRKTFPL